MARSNDSKKVRYGNRTFLVREPPTNLCLPCGRTVEKAEAGYWYGGRLYHASCPVADFDSNRAQIIGSIAELLVMEHLDQLGFEVFQSATSQYDILAVKDIVQHRIEVRTVYADATGLKVTHADERVECDFYVCVRREPLEYYIIPKNEFSSRPRKKYLGRWDQLIANLPSFLIRWLFHPRESEWPSVRDRPIPAGRVWLGLHWFGDIELYLAEILRRYEILYPNRATPEGCRNPPKEDSPSEIEFRGWVIRELSETLIHETIHSYGFGEIPWESEIVRVAAEMMRE